MATLSRALTADLASRSPYIPPTWADKFLKNFPTSGRLFLANLPTPLYKLSPITHPESPSMFRRLEELDITLYVKRDDMTGGLETGGNKIRKLEFLLADALCQGYKSVMTIGGEQSNHCRATAAASRMLGMQSHLILRTRRANDVQDGKEEFGFIGNILFDRMVGSQIYTCTPGEYGKFGSNQLLSRLGDYISKESSDGSAPYSIPVGGSNGLGSWGYINGVDEVVQQWNSLEDKPTLDHVVFASGSGGTAAGIALGIALSHKVLDQSDPDTAVASPGVHAIGVCDDPDYFYNYTSVIADEMGLELPSSYPNTEAFIRQHMTVHQGKGLGYAVNTKEELAFLMDFATETGIALDPVYSGKALFHFITSVLEEDVEQFRGKNVLFWHTGGALGLFDKVDALQPTLNVASPVKRLDLYGKGMEGAVQVSQEK